MNLLESTRAWIRGSGLIDKSNRFNANYLGAAATEYSINSAGDSHHSDVCGYDIWTANFVFTARMPYGSTLSSQLTAADLFYDLCAWIRAQDAKHTYPAADGYSVMRATPANTGLLVSADANTAQYQLQIKLTLEEI